MLKSEDDLTKQKTLEEKREFVEALLDNIEAGIVACDAEGRLTLFNQATRKFHGLPEAPLPADEWAEHYDLYLPDGVTRMQMEDVPLFRALKGEQVRDAEMVIAPREAGVAPRTVLASGQAITDEGGRTLGAVVAMHDITELRRLEQERAAAAAQQEAAQANAETLVRLRESEEQFRTLADSIPQLAWMADASGSIFWYNQRWYDYTGTTLEEMQGWGWQKVHHPDEVERVTERFRRVIATGEHWEDTFPLRSKEGEYRWFLSRALPIRDTEGRIVRWFGTNTDVEEHRRAEARMRESEERYRVVAETASDALMTIDEASVIQFVNTAAERMFGYTADEMLNANLTMLMPEEYRARHRGGVKRYIATGERHISWEAVQATGLHKDGREFPLEISFGTFIKDGKHFFSAIMRDITDRKAAEERVRASESRYRALADAMPQLVWASDGDGAHFYYNQQWYDYTGLTEEESTGSGFTNALHPEDKQRTAEHWKRALHAGEGYSIEYRFYSRPQGVYRWFLGRATPLRDESGAIVQWVGTCTDINDQKEMEVELARMNAERERMFEEVSTPVVPVLPGVLTLPLIGSLDTERMQRATDAALAEVSRTGAHTCIIDITGARIIDSYAVANLGNLVSALKLIGADAIVTGITAQAAQTLVGLGLDLSQMRTHRTLAQALAAVINPNRNTSQGTGSRTNGASQNTSQYTR